MEVYEQNLQRKSVRRDLLFRMEGVLCWIVTKVCL